MPHHPQSTNRLTERIHAVVRAALDRADVHRMVIACSGGADSIALLQAVITVARHTGRQATVCHVRHGARMDDARDAEAVQAIAHRLDVPCSVVLLRGWRADGTTPPSEAEMRHARYGALAEVVAACDAEAVLTGHTLDDQAETVLLHLMRGAGLDGLGGMAEETFLPVEQITPAGSSIHRGHTRLRVVRPLLTVRRAETVAYCAAHRLSVMNDPTNDDQHFTRNWLRHSVLAMMHERNPDIAPVLARTALLMRGDAAFLSEQTAFAMARVECRNEMACIGINHAVFASEHVAIQRRIIRDIFLRISGVMPRAAEVDAAQCGSAMSQSSMIRHSGGVTYCHAFGRLIFGHDADVRRWVHHAASQRYPLSQGVHAVSGDTRHILTLPDPAVAPYDVALMAMHQRTRDDLGSEAVAASLRLPDGHVATIRNRTPADRFWPRGNPKEMLLRTYLSSQRVPAPVRDWLPLLVVNDTIAWVIGHDVSAAFATTDANATHLAVLRPVIRQENERIVGKNARGEITGTGNGAHADDDTAQ